jgi:Transglutaminase-like superfamily
MSSGFAPSLDAESRDGVRVRRQEYPEGLAGPKLSLEVIAQFIREGSQSKLVMGWAADQLHACGLDGRSAEHTNFARASCLLDAIRKNVVYMPDPPMSENIKSAETTLCLRPGLCIRGGDCDDQIVVLGSACQSVGVPVRVVKQTFEAGLQEHVLLEGQRDDGSWFAMDPSTNMPCGQKHPASSEFRLDPNNPSMIGLKGAPEAQFVAIGGVPRVLLLGAFPLGASTLGAFPSLPSLVLSSGPYAAASQDLQNQVVLPITAGDNYYSSGEYASAITSYQAAGQAGATSVGPEIDLAGAASTTQPYTQVAWNLNTNLQEISPTSTAQTDADAARSMAVAMMTAYQAAMQFGGMALAQSGGLPPSSGAINVPQAIGLTLTFGFIGGLAFEAWRTWNHYPSSRSRPRSGSRSRRVAR